MKILEFIREWADIRRESRSYCRSCETLREQLNVANHEKKILLDQILYKPEPVAAVIEKSPEPIMPKIVPWHVQRQMLIQEDRAKAATMRRMEEEAAKAQEMKRAASGGIKAEGPIETNSISVEQLEKELAIGSEDA